MWALYLEGIDCQAALAWPKLHVKDVPCFAPFLEVHSDLSSSHAVHVLMHLLLSFLFPAIVWRPSTSIKRISTTSSTLRCYLSYSLQPPYPLTATFFFLPLVLWIPWWWSCYAFSSIQLLERTILFWHSRQLLGSSTRMKAVAT